MSRVHDVNRDLTSISTRKSLPDVINSLLPPTSVHQTKTIEEHCNVCPGSLSRGHGDEWRVPDVDRRRSPLSSLQVLTTLKKGPQDHWGGVNVCSWTKEERKGRKGKTRRDAA